MLQPSRIALERPRSIVYRNAWVSWIDRPRQVSKVGRAASLLVQRALHGRSSLGSRHDVERNLSAPSAARLLVASVAVMVAASWWTGTHHHLIELPALAPLARRVPHALRVLLHALAVIDDVGCIVALFHLGSVRFEMRRAPSCVLAALGMSIAFSAGAIAGGALNGRLVAFSVAGTPMPLFMSPSHSPVNTHVR
ncbi:MAG: Na+/H+ antiporter NhaA [Labilithrix sp.]|nr:Na+/H+ antiporter NhaA [Labilithrix sp.]MCW5812071.1 Na+/H+ antiporter NhaA [Labilithrix sp.]